METDTRKIRIAKNKMENALLKSIDEIRKQFINETGLPVTNINVRMVNVSTIGKPDDYIISGIECEVNVL